MAKGDLVGGSLWQNYSKKVAERMDHPRYLGVISEEEAASLNAELIVADHGAESCGDAVRPDAVSQQREEPQQQQAAEHEFLEHAGTQGETQLLDRAA